LFMVAGSATSSAVSSFDMKPPTDLSYLPFTDVVNSEFDFGGGIALISNAFAAQDMGLALPRIRTYGQAGVQRYGWQWQTSDANGSVQAYPEVKFGRKPWDKFSSTDLLPKRIQEVGHLKVDLKYKTEATGGCNAALDIWLMRKPDGGPEDVAAEVMVWLGMQEDARPAGDVVLPVVPGAEIASRPVSMYAGRGAAWPIFTFMPDTRIEEAVIDLGQLLPHTYSMMRNPQETWLSAVEFGNEIWSGSGSTVVYKYQVQL
jgi:hypothetical protein